MIEEDLEIEDVDDESYYLRELSKLKKKLEIALCTLGIIAMHSTDRVDAVQAAVAIEQIKETEEEE